MNVPHPETSPRELDVRSLEPRKRHPLIFETWNGLGPDAAFVLVNDHDPKPLLYQFQMEKAGAFDWNVLEAGPERWRVEVRRRAAAGSRTVSECLGTDHRRLDTILERVEALGEAGKFPEALDRFAEFRCGLNRHIDIEEQILFPAFEGFTGMTMGPTVVMRHEHVEIRTRMDAIAAALEAGNRDDLTRALSGLRAVLGEHNMKEEHVLYPMTDESTGSERAADDLVRRMQAF